MRLTVRPRAAADLQKAHQWYEEQRQGLGESFLTEIRDVLVAIEERPLQYPVVHRDVRRALVHGFPYVVLFRVLPQRVVVVGCFHGHRSPSSWRGRS